ncbi:hypothetical protein [Sphingomonas sp. Leaf25]|uniref:hypothetical protein n=1 Tax=Sphingomonas sp. Leaf25 TaxID=1735692 RepID=UPI0006F7EA65|nr:hypothetical protein [Sphingomonas sp. Leaf25]KQM98125.1 hypothetical protein ASE78_07645 [Sphingomonas sp. Leaf25]
MAMVQSQAWLLIVVTIFCAVRTYRDFAAGQTVWGIISLVATLSALAILLLIPIPTHAVTIDLPR